MSLKAADIENKLQRTKLLSKISKEGENEKNWKLSFADFFSKSLGRLRDILKQFSLKTFIFAFKKNHSANEQKVCGVIVLIRLLLAVSLWSAIRDTASPRQVLAALFRF